VIGRFERNTVFDSIFRCFRVINWRLFTSRPLRLPWSISSACSSPCAFRTGYASSCPNQTSPSTPVSSGPNRTHQSYAHIITSSLPIGIIRPAAIRQARMGRELFYVPHEVEHGSFHDKVTRSGQSKGSVSELIRCCFRRGKSCRRALRELPSDCWGRGMREEEKRGVSNGWRWGMRKGWSCRMSVFHAANDAGPWLRSMATETSRT
jgi:hypothetical protein